jgi:hypothetical protein
MEPHAFALPQNLIAIEGSATTFTLCVLVIAGDGVNPPIIALNNFTYDATQSAATNIANLKDAIVEQVASAGIQVLSSNVVVFTAVQ